MPFTFLLRKIYSNERESQTGVSPWDKNAVWLEFCTKENWVTDSLCSQLCILISIRHYLGWHYISEKFVLLQIFQGRFLSISAWLCLTWSLSWGGDPLPRVSEFLRRLCIALLLRNIQQTHPSIDELRSPVTKQDQCNGTTQRRVGFSSAGMNRVTESAWAGCWYNCQTAAGNSCCHASSDTRARAAMGPVGWDTRVCRCHCRGLLPVLTHQNYTSAICPARLEWFTCSLTHSWPPPEGKCDGNTKNLWNPTWDNGKQCSVLGAHGCQHYPGGMDCQFQLSYILTVDACP